MPNDDLTDIDPSAIIISIAVTIVLFPAVSLALDPILRQRTTLRDLLVVYKGIILAGYVAIPAWYYLIEREYPSGILVLAFLFTVAGIAWWIVVTSKHYPRPQKPAPVFFR